jgi:hypothetical protein
VGVHVLRVLSKITQKGGGPCLEGALANYSNRWGSSPCPSGHILISRSSRTHLTPIPLSFHFRHVTQVRCSKISSINCMLVFCNFVQRCSVSYKVLPPLRIFGITREFHCLNESSVAHRQPELWAKIWILNTINTDQICYFTIMHGSSIFRVSSNNLSIWTNSYQNPTQYDLFRISSKLWLTWVGVHVLRVLSHITQTGGGPVLVVRGAFSSHAHLARISLPSHSPCTFDMWLK